MALPITTLSVLVQMMTLMHSSSELLADTNPLEDGESLFQVFQQIGTQTRWRDQVTPTEWESEKRPKWKEVLDETSSCVTFAPLDLMRWYDTWRFLGYVSPRAACNPLEPAGGLVNGMLIQVSRKVGIPSGKVPILFPLTFIAVFFVVILCMLGTLLCSRASEPNARMSKNRRPELDSWNRGLLSWLFLDFVNEWVKRWGQFKNADLTQITADELGRLGDPEDDCAQSYSRLSALWKQEVDVVGIEKASLVKVLTRCITWKRILLLGFWTAVYEAFMYIGPPLAMSLLIRTMDSIYIERLHGGVFEHAELIPVTCVVIALFTGIPIVCSIASTFSSLLGMRISARMCGALSCLVYHKAQRLPTSSQIRATQDLPTPQRNQNQDDQRTDPDARTNDEAQAKGKEATDKLASKSNHGHLKRRNDIDETSMEDHIESPDKFNLVQVVAGDANLMLAQVPLALSKVIVSFPITIALMVMLVTKIGASMLLIILVCIAMLGLMYKVGNEQASQMYGFLYWSGKRLVYLEDLFLNIRGLKSCGWESLAEDKSNEIRHLELAWLRSYFWRLGILWTLIQQFPKVMVVISLWVCMWLNGKTQVEDIWVILPLLYTFQSAFLSQLQALPTVVNAIPSLLRLQAFMKLREAPSAAPRNEQMPLWMQSWPESCLQIPALLPDPTAHLKVQGSFSWMRNGQPVLKEIDLIVPAGCSLAVLGKVGSGKSTLLMSMLGELYPVGDARVSFASRAAFSGQMPCIMEGTLRENVLSGSDFDPERYNAAIHSSYLHEDLEVLPAGELARVGSRGICLSGGQKTRIAMARAAYSDAPLKVIDDPFSALDACASQHILEHYIFGDMLKNTTRVVATDPDAERIQGFDHVLILEDGRIAVQGSPVQIMQTKEYRDLLNSHQVEALDSRPKRQAQQLREVSELQAVAVNRSYDECALQEEERQGRATWADISYILTSGGKANACVAILGYLNVVLSNLMGGVVLQRWSTEQMLYKSSKAHHLSSASTYFWPYIFWWANSIAFFWVTCTHGMRFSINTSFNVNRDLMKRLLCAPVDHFYDKTPVGRIMNRLTTDLTQIDTECFNETFQVIMAVWQDVVPILYVHLLMPIYFSIGSVPIYSMLILLLRRYFKTMIPLRYLSQVSKSRTDTVLVEVDTCLPYIRAAQLGDVKFAEFMDRMDDQIKTDLGSHAYIKRWAVSRILLLVGFYMTSVVLLCVWLPDTLSFGALGLCLTNMLVITISIEGDLEAATKLQLQFVYMNRLHEYTNLASEAPAERSGDKRYASFVTFLDRRALGVLEYTYDSETSALVIRRRNQLGEPGQLLLVHKADTQAFIAPAGRSLADLDPKNTCLQQTYEWHRLVSVNEASGDAYLMAQELCNPAGHQTRQHVRLQVESGWLADSARVSIKQFSAGYADIPRMILKDVSLDIEPCSSVAFVGPTGCGKSTLLLCMLRIIERRAGIIQINDVDVADIGLHTLRTTVGFVPQDPLILNASMRDNLDPFHCYEDSQLWEALRIVGFEKDIKKMPGELASNLAGASADLSFGQRQLLCIARLVIQQPPLILLDEATSGLDPKTHEVVQRTIETRFPNSTLLVVAHRLETVLDFDKIVVMDNGRIVEQGSARHLMHVKNGLFARMLAKSNIATKD